MSQPQNEVDSLLILLAKQQTNIRVRGLLYLEAIASLVGAITFMGLAINLLSEPGDYLLEACITLGVGLVFLIACKHFTTKSTAKESIHITPDTFTIINNSLLRKSELQYEVAGISNMRYQGRKHMTDHPLKGNSFDYLGFQTQQELIDTVHDEGNISFEYEGKTVYFGKSVPSWDAEELDRQLRQVTAGKLYIQNLPESIEDVGAI